MDPAPWLLLSHAQASSQGTPAWAAALGGALLPPQNIVRSYQLVSERAVSQAAAERGAAAKEARRRAKEAAKGAFRERR